MRMLFISSIGEKTTKMEVVIEHTNKENVVWNVSSFDTKTMTTDFDLFEQINAYWAQLSTDKQDEIYNLFREIRRAFDEIMDRNMLTYHIKELITMLYSYHQLEDIKRWVLFKSNIFIPSVLESEYVQDSDRPGSRDQTYLREDYVNLVCFSLALRLMVPIWGEYIYRTKQEAGTTFKEYYAYLLLSNTELATCEANHKLKLYIESNIPKELPKTAIIDGVSSEDYPIWILGLITVRRVCIGDIRGLDTTNPKLVSFLFKFISSKVKSSEGSFAGIVTDKTSESSSTADEESGGSKFEGYKIRQDITIGDKAYLEFVMNNIHSAALKIHPGLDVAMLDRALETVKALENTQLNIAQVTLAKWVFKSIVSPRAFAYFSKLTVLKAIAATQVILWQWDYKDLSLLVSSIPTTGGDSIRVTNSDMKKYLTDLTLLYPYHKQTNNKTKSKIVNHAAYAIELLVDKFTENDWLITTDINLVTEVLGDRPILRLTLPANLHARLASLITDKLTKLSPSYPKLATSSF